jgi:hypothetical protein
MAFGDKSCILQGHAVLMLLSKEVCFVDVKLPLA